MLFLFFYSYFYIQFLIYIQLLLVCSNYLGNIINRIRFVTQIIWSLFRVFPACLHYAHILPNGQQL